MIPRRSHRKRKSTGVVMLDYLSDEDGDLNEAAKRQKQQHDAFEEVRGDLQKILTSLMRHQYAAPFNQPVDPVALNIPDYFEKITNPMDFSTIQKKMDSSQYTNVDDFAEDIRLVFTNCFSYNPPTSQICHMAGTLSKLFEKKFKQVRDKQSRDEITEMESIIVELKSEHHKLLQELQKLIKDTGSTSPEPTPETPMPVGTPEVTATPRARKSEEESVKAELVPPFAFEQKQKLTERVNDLSPENLQRLVDLITAEMGDPLKNGELEIDLESMSDSILHKLDQFITQALNEQFKAEGSAQTVQPVAAVKVEAKETVHTTPANVTSADTTSTQPAPKKEEDDSSSSSSDSDSSSSSDSDSDSD